MLGWCIYRVENVDENLVFFYSGYSKSHDMSKILKSIAISWIGALLALITFAFLTGKGGKGKGALGKLLGGFESYGSVPPGDIARANDPTDSMYEFPLQSNNARRPARTNNRTLQNVRYPVSGAPSMLPTAPMSIPMTTSPGAPSAAAYEPNIWSGISPETTSFGSALLDDLLPSATAAPVRGLDGFSSIFAGRESATPLGS